VMRALLLFITTVLLLDWQAPLLAATPASCRLEEKATSRSVLILVNKHYYKRRMTVTTSDPNETYADWAEYLNELRQSAPSIGIVVRPLSCRHRITQLKYLKNLNADGITIFQKSAHKWALYNGLVLERDIYRSALQWFEDDGALPVDSLMLIDAPPRSEPKRMNSSREQGQVFRSNPVPRSTSCIC
jgi:hypothetical protein